MGEAPGGFTTQEMSANDQLKAGWIKQITLTNFMCHSLAKIDFIKHVNFITGQNGSGKSAILTALCIAFGTKARSTQRATNLKDFIKTGESYAVVEVVLCNEGVYAYKSDVYGDSIILERRLTCAGGSFFTLKDSRGKKVTGKREEIEELAAHFFIEVDNPCVIMTQDKSREFLHSGSEKDKFKFFAKATLLEAVIQVIKDAQTAMEIGEQLLVELKCESKPLEEQVKKLEERVEAMHELENMQENINKHKKLFAWSHVYEKDPDIQRASTAMGKLGEEAEACHRKMEEAQLAAVEAEAQVEASKRNLEEATAKSDELTRQERESMAALAETTRSKGALQAQTQTKRRRINDYDLQIADLQRLIDQEQQKAAQETQAEASQRQDEFAAKKSEANAAEEEYKRQQEVSAGLERQNEELKAQRSGIHQKVEDLKGRQRERVAWQRRLQEQSMNRITAFGGDSVLRLLEQIEKNAHRFHKPPIGPIGAHLSLLDDTYALAVEVSLGKNFDSFVVTNLEDSKLLQQLGRKVNHHRSTVIYNFNIPPIRPSPEQVPDPQYLTVEKVLNIGDPVVRNVLIDLAQIEKTVLVRDYEEGREIAFARGTRIKECIAQDGYKFFVREGQECAVKKPYNIQNGRLKKDLEADKAQAQREVQQLEMERRELEQQIEPLSRQIRECDAHLHKARNQAERAERQLRRLRNEIRTLENQAERERAQAAATVDVSAFEREIQSCRAEVEACTAPLGELQRQLDEAIKAEAEKKARHQQVADQLNEALQEIERLEDVNYKCQTNAEQRIQDVAHWEQQKSQKENERELCAQELKELEEMKEDLRKKASGYCDEPGPEECPEITNRSKAYLQRKILELERKRESHQERQGNLSKEEVTRKWEKLKKRSERRAGQIMVLDNRFEKLRRALKIRRKSLKEVMEFMRCDVNWRFSEHLNRKGAKGKIDIDYREQTLSMEIELPSDASGTSVKDTRALSGGERSFSTLCYALTLHSMVEAPFRAMDEFDIFMDNITRKICLEEAVNFALHNGSQWIFITPHDISAVEAGPYVKKQQMPSPRNT